MSTSELQAYGIAQFCAVHNISRSTLYVLLSEGRGPATMKVGKRTLISVEAAAAWRAKLTGETQKAA